MHTLAMCACISLAVQLNEHTCMQFYSSSHFDNVTQCVLVCGICVYLCVSVCVWAAEECDI